MSTAFLIILDGGQQVPVVGSTKTGHGTAVFDSANSSMSIQVNFQGFDWGPLLGEASQTPGTTADDVTGIHIHNAARGVNGGIVLDWPGGGDADDFSVSSILPDGSRTLSSIWETTDANSINPFTAGLGAATAGSDAPLYVNIHTVANGGGEIRGQLVCIATDSANTVTGSTFGDFLPGLGGDDTINGGAGNDTIDGGTGADAMNGGTENDTYLVDSAGDAVTENANEGTDNVISSISYTLTANVENLTLQTFVDNTSGFGNDLANVITGDFYANTLDGGLGADTLIGGLGNDSYLVDNIGDVVTENVNGGSDTVYSTVDYRLSSNVEYLVLQGGAMQGYGNSQSNAVYGTSGDNLLDGDAGADSMYGGAGNDSYFLDNISDLVVENANEGFDTVYSSANFRLSADVEYLVLQGSAVQGYGNALSNAIYGTTGDNLLDGDTGADLMYGGAGNDSYFLDNIADLVIENANEGFDTVYSTANFRLSANLEYLVLQGGAVQGYGNALSNAIYGTSDDNLLDGDAGADSMYGGAGNDSYFLDDISDLVIENANEGFDTVYSTANYRLSANVEYLVLQGGAMQGYGNALSNAIYGTSGDNLLDGDAGADSMYGGAGNDVYFVDNIADLAIENPGEGNDTVYATVDFRLAGNLENLILQGSADLQGYGDAGVNAIFGNTGGNLLDGGGGADTITGDAGNDTFVFHAGEANGDTVTDFVGNGAAAGDALAFFGYGTAAQGATFTQIGVTNQWTIHAFDNSINEVITLSNGALIDPTDYVFMV